MKIKNMPFVLIAVSLFLLTACSSNMGLEKKTDASMPTPAEFPKPVAYTIQPGDSLDIKFFYNPELNESVIVRPDGKISLQLIDDIKASELAPSELDALLTQNYSKELRKPELTVIVRSFVSQRIFVGGEVNRPGLIPLAAGMSPVQAVFQAGGLKDTAQLKETILIRKGENNKPIPIRLDLAAAIVGNGSGAGFQLQPDDIVYIPKSAIAKANLWVSQYIKQLILFNGWSFGMSYRIDTNSN